MPPRRGLTLLVAGGIAASALVTPQPTSAAVPGSVSTAAYARSAPLPTTTYAVVETIPVGSDPGAIAIDQDDDTIYVANVDSDTVSIVRGSDYEVVDTIAVGDRPCDLAVDSVDDTLYVANNYGGTLSVIEGRSLDDSVTIALGPLPCGVGVNQGDDTIYVLNSDDSDMSVINGHSLDDSVTISVGHYPQSVAVDQTDDTVYVTNQDDSTLSVINGRVLDDSVTIGGFIDPIYVAVNDADDTVYVPSAPGGSLSVINGHALDDSSSINGFGNPRGIAVDQFDDRVYVANDQDPGTVSVVDGRTGTGIDDTIAVGSNPTAVAKSATTGMVYVSNTGDNTVSVISDVTPFLVDSSGAVGESITLDIDGPNNSNDPLMDDSTVTSVFFDGAPLNWSRSAGVNSINIQVPPGSGTADVTVAFNGGNSASAGTFTYVTPGAPGTPYGWTGSGQATIKWASPDDTGAAPVTDYVLEWATSPSGPWDDSITVPRARASVTGLANGTAYRFRVSAVNAFGIGPASSLSSPLTPRAFANWAYTLDDTIVLPLFANPTAVAVTDDTAFFTLTTRKVIAIRQSDNTAVGALMSVGSSPVGIAVTPDQSKAYVVNQGCCDDTTGVNRPSVSVINTRAQSVSSTILDSNFVAPQGVVATDDTAFITNFRDPPRTSRGFVAVIRARDDTVVGSITNSATIQIPYAVALTPDLSRLYVADLLNCLTVVNARTNVVESWQSPADCNYPQAVAATDDTVFVANTNGRNVSAFRRSDNTAVGLPIPVGAQPSGVALSPDGTRAYVSAYEPGVGGISTRSTVSVIDTVANLVVATIALPDRASPFDLAVSTDGSRVYVPGYGTGEVYVIGVRPVPGAPTGVTATPGDGSASVSWTVGDTGGSALTRVNFALDDTTTIDDSTANVVSPHTLTGLANGTTYRVYVQAVNANGAGPWSTYATVTPLGAPAAPIITSVTSGNASASVSWTVDDTGGAPLTGLQFALDDTTTFSSTGSTTSPLAMSGLTNGRTYRVFVRAVNAAGAGAWSLASNPFTPTGPPAPPGQVPSIAPASQSLSGVAQKPVQSTTAFRAGGFTQTPRYGIYPPLPAGLSIDPASGVVSGTPKEAYASTRHWITAAAGGGTESATSVLQVYVAEAPAPPPIPTPTMIISGTRTTGRAKPGIRVIGTSTGLDRGAILRPWMKFPGQASFTEGAARISVDERGSFAWDRTTGKPIHVYLQTEDGRIRSNRIVIPVS